MEITITISEELAARLRPYSSQIPYILELGLRACEEQQRKLNILAALPPATILILEDATKRTQRFQTAVKNLIPEATLHTFTSAHDFIASLPTQLATVRLISLDHDLLIPGPNGEDPGDGLDAARALAALEPSCPVIIHSSNADRAMRMQGILELEGWPVHIVLPFGEDWIEYYWTKKAVDLLSSP